MLRKLLNEYISSSVTSKSVGLLFSGGMDSLSILLSMIDCDIHPTLYTFYVDGYISEDIIYSRKIAKLLNLEIVEVKLSTNVDSLISDVESIIRNYNVKKKTQVQCIHPFTHIVKYVKEEVVFSGLCADDLYGSSRKMAEASKDKDRFNAMRLDKVRDIHSSSYTEIKSVFENNNIKMICPYKEYNKIINFFMSLSYKEMNSPKQKNIMYVDYEDFLVDSECYRRNSNLQCNSKLRELHDTLLSTSLNKNNNKSVVAIYNSMWNKIQEENNA